MRRFSSGKYGRQRLEFFPAPYKAPLRAFAALVFVWDGEKVLLSDIEDRGWCIPSGRVEPHEEPIEAAIREAREEGGALLADVQYIGCYRITERSEVRWADVFTSRVEELVELPPEFESKERRLVAMEDVAGLYHLWNDLTAEVFEHAREITKRRCQAS